MKLTLTIDHAEAVFLAGVLSAARDQAAELGLKETDSDEQHRHMKDFQHASALGERLRHIARHTVFGW